MISYIEGPHEDEPLFSLLARIYGGLIGPSRAQFAQHLFRNPRLVIPFDFPCGIEALTKTIGSRVGLTAEDLIHRHTMFPIAAFLMSAELAERVKVAMRGDRAVAMNLLKWHRDPAQDGLRHLNFCSKCSAGDLRRIGHTWWRRVHQVPGVFCCPIHGDPLEVSQFVPGQFWKFDYPLAADAVSIRRARTPDGIDVTYARDVRWMLRNNPRPIDPDRLRLLYHEQLDRRGLLQGGQLRRTEFLHQFFAQRTEHEWAQRHLLFDPDDASAWPAQTVKNKVNHRSFRMHLLVMRFLDLSIESIHARLETVRVRAPANAQLGEDRLRAQLRKRWFDPAWTMNALKADLGVGIVRLLGLANKEGLPVPRLPNAERTKAFRLNRTRHRKTVSGGRPRVTKTQWQTAVTAGTFAVRDVASLRALRKARAKLKCPHLDPVVVDREIDRMIDSLFESGPANCPYSPLLGEGFALSSTSNDLQVTRTFHRLDTSRAMAKTLFTLLKSVIPRSLERPMAESLAHLARFAKGEVAAPDPILFQRLSRKPVRRHHLRVEFGPKGFCFEVVLYNALSWRMQGRGVAANGEPVPMPVFVWEAVDDAAISDVVVRP